jgi:hypothetical protein
MYFVECERLCGLRVNSLVHREADNRVVDKDGESISDA